MGYKIRNFIEEEMLMREYEKKNQQKYKDIIASCGS
jgi:hypothetical protein